MSLYTLMLATVVTVNKELPVQSGLTLEECTVAAMHALQAGSNFARCRPPQPEAPVILIRLPSGVVVQMERGAGGYRLPAGYSQIDEAFVATALGKPSSNIHSRPHGADLNPLKRKVPEALATE
jgi:hypothetical protein